MNEYFVSNAMKDSTVGGAYKRLQITSDLPLSLQERILSGGYVRNGLQITSDLPPSLQERILNGISTVSYVAKPSVTKPSVQDEATKQGYVVPVEKTKNKARTGDEIITRYMSLVPKIAGKLVKRLPANIQLDELEGIGYEALVTIAREDRLQKGVTEKTYISIRIKGSMIDELRKRDHLPRSVRNAKRDLVTAKQDLEDLLGRVPSREEVRLELGWTQERYDQVDRTNTSSHPISTSAPIGDDEDGRTIEDTLVYQDEISADETIDRENSKVFARKLLSRLPLRHRKIMEDHFFGGKTLKEISEKEGVHESRISQLKRWALEHLREHSDVDDYL